MESLSGEDTTTTTVFVDTNLDTHFATTVSDSITVYDLKRKVVLDHHQCFPGIGVIKVDGLKVKRKGQFYHLSDWTILKSVLPANKNCWFISVDASCLENHVDQHTITDDVTMQEVERLKPTEVMESEEAVINEEKVLSQSEKKESQDDSREEDIVTNNSAIQPQKLVSENENKKVPTDVVNDPNISNVDQFKTSKKVSKVDAPRTNKSTEANKAQKPTLGEAIVKTMQKSTPVVNRLQRVRGSSYDNTSLGKPSSSGDSAYSVDSRRNGSRVVERKEVVGVDGVNSENKSKNMSVTGLLRSKPRFKKAKVSASQELDDTESETVEFVPESPPMSKG